MSQVNETDRGPDSARLFDSIFDSHHEAVVRYCARRLGRSDADDAAAEVFAIAWRRLDEVPVGDATRAWLIGVAHKVVGNSFRSRQRRTRLSLRLQSEHRAGPQVTEAPEAGAGLVLQALDRLNGRDRELIRLSSWDGLTRSEIAHVLGIRINAVDQRLHRARSRLKELLNQLSADATSSRPEEASI